MDVLATALICQKHCRPTMRNLPVYVGVPTTVIEATGVHVTHLS